MFKKENLLSISDLKGPAKITAMSDGQFATYNRSLNTFIDNFPGQADRMRAAVSKQSFEDLKKTLLEVSNLLEVIFAHGLAQDAKRQVDVLNKGSVDSSAAEAFIEKFILNVSSLSIDIQMSSHKAATASSARAATAEPTTKQFFSAGSQGGGGPTILAVDNAVMFLNTLKSLLKGSPYDLHCVTSGSDALDFVGKGTRIDLFLLDIEMPGMDGYELAAALKRNGQRAPVIFVTANSAREYVDKAISVQAAGLLMKPLRSQQLLSKIKECI
ncbi:MAG: response regulator [Oscillospiraceae bacterium]|nr:response regulator [Oscillospiraceae bacterium]